MTERVVNERNSMSECIGLCSLLRNSNLVVVQEEWSRVSVYHTGWSHVRDCITCTLEHKVHPSIFSGASVCHK